MRNNDEKTELELFEERSNLLVRICEEFPVLSHLFSEKSWLSEDEDVLNVLFFWDEFYPTQDPDILFFSSEDEIVRLLQEPNLVKYISIFLNDLEKFKRLNENNLKILLDRTRYFFISDFENQNIIFDQICLYAYISSEMNIITAETFDEVVNNIKKTELLYHRVFYLDLIKTLFFDMAPEFFQILFLPQLQDKDNLFIFIEILKLFDQYHELSEKNIREFLYKITERGLVFLAEYYLQIFNLHLFGANSDTSRYVLNNKKYFDLLMLTGVKASQFLALDFSHQEYYIDLMKKKPIFDSSHFLSISAKYKSYFLDDVDQLYSKLRDTEFSVFCKILMQADIFSCMKIAGYDALVALILNEKNIFFNVFDRVFWIAENYNHLSYSMFIVLTDEFFLKENILKELGDLFNEYIIKNNFDFFVMEKYFHELYALKNSSERKVIRFLKNGFFCMQYYGEVCLNFPFSEYLRKNSSRILSILSEVNIDSRDFLRVACRASVLVPWEKIFSGILILISENFFSFDKLVFFSKKHHNFLCCLLKEPNDAEHHAVGNRLLRNDFSAVPVASSTVSFFNAEGRPSRRSVATDTSDLELSFSPN